MSYKFKKNKHQYIIGLICLLVSLVFFSYLGRNGLTWIDWIICLVPALLFAYISMRHYNLHKSIYLKVSGDILYVYNGVFKGLRKVQMTSINVVMVIENKIRILTDDGLELILNCNLIEKSQAGQLVEELKKYVPTSKWAR